MHACKYIYMMHACIYVYIYSSMVELCHLIHSLCLNRNILIRLRKPILKRKQKMKRKEKRKKIAFSPGWYYQPGLKGAGLVACQEAPLVPVPDPGLKDPL